jgi:hypothetical protein
MEGENPTRRYKSFRPYQAARGGITATQTSTNYATLSLFNDSRVAQLLVLRSAGLAWSNGAITRGYNQGALGTHVGTEFPFIADRGQPPGQIYYQDAAAVLPRMIPWTPGASTADYGPIPIAILGPGWSFVLQINALAASITYADLMWEAVALDELEWVDW